MLGERRRLVSKSARLRSGLLMRSARAEDGARETVQERRDELCIVEHLIEGFHSLLKRGEHRAQVLGDIVRVPLHVVANGRAEAAEAHVGVAAPGARADGGVVARSSQRASLLHRSTTGITREVLAWKQRSEG